MEFPEVVENAGNITIGNMIQDESQMGSETYETATPIQSSPQSTDSTENMGSTESSTTSSAPRNFRLISRIYDDTEQIEIADDLLLLSVEELYNFDEAAQEIEWKKGHGH